MFAKGNRTGMGNVFLFDVGGGYGGTRVLCIGRIDLDQREIENMVRWHRFVERAYACWMELTTIW